MSRKKSGESVVGYVDPAADLIEEQRDVDLWPCTGRRRPPVTEWDDYIDLYGEAVIPEIEEDVPPIECPLCHITSKTVQGLSIHLARTHGEHSERSEYYRQQRARREGNAS